MPTADFQQALALHQQGRLAEAVENVRAIILAERCRTNPRYTDL